MISSQLSQFQNFSYMSLFTEKYDRWLITQNEANDKNAVPCLLFIIFSPKVSHSINH